VTHPAEQQTSPVPAYPAPGAGYPPPPGGYSVPPTALPRYGYPSGGFRPPGPVGPGGTPLAEPWQRLVAYLLDSLIVGAVLLIPVLLLFAALFAVFFTSIQAGSPPGAAEILLLEVVGFAIILPLQIIASYVYYVRMCHKTGQTVGKRVMKIRVVRAVDGGAIDLRVAKRRWIVQHVSAVVAFYFNLADALWLLWDQPYRQCLHDKCAETLVVQVTA
jgi:uncharacterized RDD family membrane protein YckC